MDNAIKEIAINSHPTFMVIMGYPAGVITSTDYCYAPSFTGGYFRETLTEY
jgi:hypothetical protein